MALPEIFIPNLGDSEVGDGESSLFQVKKKRPTLWFQYKFWSANARLDFLLDFC